MKYMVRYLLMSLITVATGPAFGDVEPDKKAHFAASGAISALTYKTLDKNSKARYSKAVLVSFSFGMAKELMIDKRADKNDVAANALGALIGPFLVWEF